MGGEYGKVWGRIATALRSSLLTGLDHVVTWLLTSDTFANICHLTCPWKKGLQGWSIAANKVRAAEP